MDEESAFTESDETFTQVTLSAYKVGTILKVSDELLNDAFLISKDILHLSSQEE